MNGSSCAKSWHEESSIEALYDVTSALAMAIAGIFGADTSVTVSVAIVTGLI